VEEEYDHPVLKNSLKDNLMNERPKLAKSRSTSATTGPDTKTRAREPQEQEADNVFVPRGLRSRLRGRRDDRNARCVIQLFREPAGRTAAIVTNSTKPKTITEQREEQDQDAGVKSYHAVPRHPHA